MSDKPKSIGAVMDGEVSFSSFDDKTPILSDLLKIPKLARVETIGDFGVERVIAIGDIHGCMLEMYDLLIKLQLKDTDTLIFLGDLVDRGPDSAAVVKSIRYWCENRPQTYCVLGNHDEKVARYRRHLLKSKETPGYKNPMKVKPDRAAEWAQLSDLDCLWIARLPAVVIMDGTNAGLVNTMFTHAGLIDGFDVRQPVDGLIRNRYLTKKDDRWAPVGWTPGHSAPPGAVIWDEIWTGVPVVYGHIVHDLKDPRIHRSGLGLNNPCYGIDTGCCFGGHLTAYVEDRKTGEVSFVQVKAFQEYEPRDKEKESA